MKEQSLPLSLRFDFRMATYEDNDLTLNGYNLLPADYPSNVKRGGKF